MRFTILPPEVKMEETPFVCGGLYYCEHNGAFYFLCDCSRGGYELVTLSGQAVYDISDHSRDGVTKYLQSGVAKWRYVPNVEVVIRDGKAS